MSAFQLNPAEFEALGQFDWDDVMLAWADREEHQSHWNEFIERHGATGGFNDWWSWRQRYVDVWALNAREWQLMSVTNPATIIPTFRGGPFKSWSQKYYDGNPCPTFAQLSQHEGVQHHARIAEIMAGLMFRKKPVHLIGLHNDGKIIIVEGTHSCLAITKARSLRIPLPNLRVNLYVANATGEKLEVFGVTGA